MIESPDPYPRELIDTWPLHDARQELLEEIVSQPGPEQSPSSTRRLLVPVGIAAALLLVVGGAWAAISAGGDDGKDDAPVAAASVDPTDPTTAETSQETATEPTQAVKEPHRDGVRRNGLRTGRVITLKNLDECLRVLRDRKDGPIDRVRRLEHGKGRGYKLYLVRKDHRIVVVDGQCHARLVKGGRVRH
ncbi:hypothetical protein [Nocardioides sp. MH1]|uniref:hypothetical protein n=1 Tax=Nocardioides sp. MH1 TaxID=3242490 RepID=UPI003521F20E